MSDWRSKFIYDPVKTLLDSGDEAIIYFTKRDLLEEEVNSINYLWDLPEARKILKKQLDNGSWPFKGKKNEDCRVKYSLIETWKQLRVLIQKYEMNNAHPA